MECRLRLLGRACTLEVMSYGGRVQCRCWKEGIATVAPFPVVGFEEGWPVSYDDASLSPEECRRRDRELAEWRKKGCLHPGMAMCERWITNISGMSMFRQALGDHAHGDCPCLERELPRYNGGETAPADARAIRHELEVLRGNLATDASPVVVTNSHGLQVMFEGDAPRSIVEDATNWLLDGRSNSPTTLATGSFALLGRDPAPDYADGWAYGLGQDALQIFHNNEVVLRGMRLTQRPIRSTAVIPTRFPSQKECPTLLPCPVSVRDDESGTLVTLPDRSSRATSPPSTCPIAMSPGR
ncbi:MAG: hypothetical protein QOF81_1218, partial [Acidimicrobiaceae bacterium]|nr:hypothetical protein [Acidimicrobiaceae bacterium]